MDAVSISFAWDHPGLAFDETMRGVLDRVTAGEVVHRE